jgi:hypothetical protein
MMTNNFDYDADVPRQAVEGLNAAARRAEKSGRPMVVVRDGKLIRISNGQEVVLEILRPRTTVNVTRKTRKL